jgi:hypothetical protein
MIADHEFPSLGHVLSGNCDGTNVQLVERGAAMMFRLPKIRR